MNALWEQVYWREPLWLLLALFPVAIMMWRMLQKRHNLRLYADVNLLPWVIVPQISNKQYWKLASQLLIWLLFALSAAGPRLLISAPQEISPSQNAAVVIFDHSRSMQATDMRKGATILFRDELFFVTDFSHHTPGNKRAFVQASLKSLKTGKIIQNRFASTENVERVILEPKMCQYQYHDGEGFHFMEMESYESFAINDEIIGDIKYYLKENTEIKINFYEGHPVLPEIPKIVVLKVTDSPPWVKGDSVSNNMKPGVCETGLKIQIPLFIGEGTEIKVNTDTGEYLGRA